MYIPVFVDASTNTSRFSWRHLESDALILSAFKILYSAVSIVSNHISNDDNAPADAPRRSVPNAGGLVHQHGIGRAAARRHE